jgi:hypothetical protein
MNKVVKEVILVNNIDHTPAGLNHHDDIGRVELFMRTIQESLNVIALAKKGNWHEALQHVVYTYRSTIHSSVGKNPFQELYGRDMWLVSDALIEQREKFTKITQHVSRLLSRKTREIGKMES